MSTTAQVIASMVDILPEGDQKLAYEMIKRMVLAWDPDFTKVTPEEARHLEEAERKEFLEEMISPHLHTMFVTPKDVDETVKYLSFTISEGLNLAFC